MNELLDSLVEYWEYVDGEWIDRCKDKKCEGFEGPCENMNAERYHMNTQYNNEEMNYATHCPSCKEDSELRWKDMWDEVRSGYY